MERFEIQPLAPGDLPAIASFLRERLHLASETPAVEPINEEAPDTKDIERRLRWLLLDNPASADGAMLGYGLRGEDGAIRGIDLAYPVHFAAAGRRLRALGSGSFFVDEPARSAGFYLFKRYLAAPGYDFHFSSTCNSGSAGLWKQVGGCMVPHSDSEYVLPLRLEVTMPAYVAGRTSSAVAERIARLCGRAADPILRFLTRPSEELQVERSEDWDKLAALSMRHQPAGCITTERTPGFLEWRYGAGSPLSPSNVYLMRDKLGNEGWFALGDLSRGRQVSFRESVLLDAIWPRERFGFQDALREMIRVALEQTDADAIFFHWRPGMESSEYGPWVMTRRLAAPRAYVKTPKGAAALPLHQFDYDDSDYVAWRFR